KGVPEKYAVVKQVLSILNYPRYQWNVQADLKMINIISGLMAASCKYPCVFCCWDSRATHTHYDFDDWEEWDDDDRSQGLGCFVRTPLVHPSRLVLPELHIKMG